MYVFTDKRSSMYKSEIEKAVLENDSTAEIWENGIVTSLTPQQVNEVVPVSVKNLRVQEHGRFSETLRNGLFDVCEHGFVYNSYNEVTARI